MHARKAMCQALQSANPTASHDQIIQRLFRRADSAEPAAEFSSRIGAAVGRRPGRDKAHNRRPAPYNPVDSRSKYATRLRQDLDTAHSSRPVRCNPGDSRSRFANHRRNRRVAAGNYWAFAVPVPSATAAPIKAPANRNFANRNFVVVRMESSQLVDNVY